MFVNVVSPAVGPSKCSITSTTSEAHESDPRSDGWSDISEDDMSLSYLIRDIFDDQHMSPDLLLPLNMILYNKWTVNWRLLEDETTQINPFQSRRMMGSENKRETVMTRVLCVCVFTLLLDMECKESSLRGKISSLPRSKPDKTRK